MVTGVNAAECKPSNGLLDSPPVNMRVVEPKTGRRVEEHEEQASYADQVFDGEAKPTEDYLMARFSFLGDRVRSQSPRDARAKPVSPDAAGAARRALMDMFKQLNAELVVWQVIRLAEACHASRCADAALGLQPDEGLMRELTGLSAKVEALLPADESWKRDPSFVSACKVLGMQRLVMPPPKV